MNHRYTTNWIFINLYLDLLYQQTTKALKLAFLMFLAHSYGLLVCVSEFVNIVKESYDLTHFMPKTNINFCVKNPVGYSS